MYTLNRTNELYFLYNQYAISLQVYMCMKKALTKSQRSWVCGGRE